MTETPFQRSATSYLDAGFYPFPVKRKLPPVIGATGRHGTVTPDKVGEWLSSPPFGYHNVALRHDGTLAVDVDAGYGDKDGVTHLRTFAESHRLPELPATWSSTARGDESPSRQYLYRLPADFLVTATENHLSTKPCEAVELCYRNHRYTVCAPSVHPDTGVEYAWYLPGDAGVPPTWGDRTSATPIAAELPELPGEWLDVFRRRGGIANPAADKVHVFGEDDLLSTFRAAGDGVPIGKPLVKVKEAAGELSHIGHDDFKRLAFRSLMLGREGVPGAADVYLWLRNEYSTYLESDRPEVAEFELTSLVEFVIDGAQREIVWRWCVGITDDGTPLFTNVCPSWADWNS